MKKLITAFLCIIIVLSLSMTAFAAELNQNDKSKGVDIGTAVPTNHIVTIVTDENSIVNYGDELLENGDKISVLRLSSPEFLIHSKDGFQLNEIMLDAANVMSSIKNDRFTIDSIHKDVTLTVNSEKKAVVPKKKYTVVGTITQNDSPLAGAVLKLCEAEKFTTKDDGKFAFRDVEDGFHTLTAYNNDKQVGYIAFEIRPNDNIKTIEITKAEDGTYIINIGKDYNIVELNFNLKDDGVIDIPDGEVHEDPEEIIDFPQTGDTGPINLFIIIAIGSIMVVLMLMKKRKFEKSKR